MEVAEEIVRTAFTTVTEKHFAMLYSNIDNQMREVPMLKTTVASLVENNKMLEKVRGNAPDLEMQPPATPPTRKEDLTISPRLPPAPSKRGGSFLFKQVGERYWGKQAEKNNSMPMDIHKSDAEPWQPGKN